MFARQSTEALNCLAETVRQPEQPLQTASVQYAEQRAAAGMKPVHAPVVIAALDFAQASETPLQFGEGDARQSLSHGLKADLAGTASFTEVA